MIIDCKRLISRPLHCTSTGTNGDSIGDTHQARAKDSFLPDHTTHSLAEQANTCLQDAVRRDGQAFIPHLGGFIIALREELDSPGGLTARNPPSVERRPYRMDVKPDGSGIERYASCWIFMTLLFCRNI